MLMPKKTKYRKTMKGNMKGTETRGTELEFGSYGLGGFIEDDYIEIKDFALDGNRMTISPAGEADDYQSDCGIWNASNNDHTKPTLEVKYFESENNDET